MARSRPTTWRSGATVVVATLAALLAGCGTPTQADPDADPDQVDAVETPELGACRLLTIEEISAPSDATRTVDCSQKHTAQTYAVGELPDELRESEYDAPEVGEFAYRTCNTKLSAFLGADESLAMRTILSWAWFRPSEKAWDEGARWYRCDVVGGGEQSAALVPLPETAEGLLQGRPDDAWMACVAEPAFAGSKKIPCSQEHQWRAVTTIKLGEAADPYPGDRLSEVQSRDFCSKSVLAYLNYPVEYDFAYTWFHESEWNAGNRRSVCWARTSD
ncbi:hypothetical protein FE634_09715 [Nocardioides dongxiaopingii]|uniref:septum formation family protein n=1 Tax=Nocardioides TaxID=1839 RepID=UPI0010C763AA|nr:MULTISPECIES: septum formation family protein [Nocardioides]QCW50626.1 hypothetical protein FE634_09715 [Nocardioides sp. S-1144]